MLVFSVLQRTCTRAHCLCTEVMVWVELWQCSGTTSNDFWSLGCWGTRKSPSCYSCVSSVWCEGLPSCRGSGCRSQEQHRSRMSGEVLPQQPRAVSHAPASSSSAQFKRQAGAVRHVPQKAVSIGLPERFPGSFISLCLVVSNEEAERRESQQIPSCWDFFIFSSGF